MRQQLGACSKGAWEILLEDAGCNHGAMVRDHGVSSNRTTPQGSYLGNLYHISSIPISCPSSLP